MKASPAYLLSQLTNLVVGSACFIAAISAATYLSSNAKQAFFAPDLSVSPSLVSWISEMHPAFSENTIAAGTASAADTEGAAISKEIGVGLAKIAKLEKRAEVQRHTILNKKHFAVAHVTKPAMKIAKTIAQATPQASASGSAQDMVEMSQSSVEVPMTKAEKLQKIHAELTRHFYMAMNGTGQILAELNTHTAEPTDIQFKSDMDIALETAQKSVSDEKAKKKGHRTAKGTQTPQRTASVAEEAVAVAAAPQPEPPKDYSETRLHAAVVAANPSNSSEVFKLGKLATQLDSQSADTTSDQKLAAVAHAEAAPLDDGAFVPPQSPLVLANSPQGPPPQPVGENQNNAINGDAGSSVQMSTSSAQTLTQMAQVGRSMWSGYPSGGKALDTQAQAAIGYSKRLNTQEAATPSIPSANTSATTSANAAPAAKPALVAGKPVSLNDTVHVSSSVESEVGNLISYESPARWNFAEAFDWGQALPGVQVEVLSHEGGIDTLGNARNGWRIARTAQHWGTLFWARAPIANTQQDEIPVLHANSAKMLAFKAGVTLQADAGIVIAKVPAGWSLEFSGRSERALIFDRANRLLGASSVDEDRYYVFLNASPGEQILYLTRSSGETGALAVPVLGSLVAYADLTQVQKKTISGRVMIVNSDSGVRAMSGMRVQVVGSSASAVSGAKGIFKIENVITFGDQSLYLETESQKNFPHRYKVSPYALDNLTLFNLGEEQVHDWVSQLEGGMSSESGLVVGALPSLAGSEENYKPIVETRSLALNPTLTPETYTLSSSGQLLVKSPLTAAHSRFVSVQVPEGPTLIQAVDHEGKVLWSEITVVSPRVLTVVGPY